MTKDPEKLARLQLGGVLLIGAVAAAAFWVGQGAAAGLAMAALMLAFALVIWFGRRRSDALATVSGVGDERTRLLNQRAVAFSGNLMSFVLPGWWLVTVAQGDPDTTLTVLCAVMGFAYLAGSVYYARRS